MNNVNKNNTMTVCASYKGCRHISGTSDHYFFYTDSRLSTTDSMFLHSGGHRRENLADLTFASSHERHRVGAELDTACFGNVEDIESSRLQC